MRLMKTFIVLKKFTTVSKPEFRLCAYLACNNRILLITFLFMLGCNGSGTIVSESMRPDTLAVLYDRYELWRGTPHKLGGYDRAGIDCSGLVALTYADEFGINLPRSTKHLSTLKGEIPKQKLNSGDLVFFKIPKQKRYYHVGIYLEDDKFMHASTSKGVIISDLKNNYWQDSYWKSIRVLK